MELIIMKRSEMLYLIEKAMKEVTPVCSDTILLRIEEAGMLPPGYITEIGNSEYGEGNQYSYYVDGVARWENED